MTSQIDLQSVMIDVPVTAEVRRLVAPIGSSVYAIRRSELDGIMPDGTMGRQM